jgi:KDO2-lipid IV(A) lauroyltransferase
MQRITFFFFYIGINLFRVVPFFLLYFFSYITYLIIYYLVGYRKKVVFQNLKQSFPEKSEKEIKKLTKDFFKHNLAPVFAEGLKGFTMNKKQLLSRYKVKNSEILNNYFEKGQDIIALATHYGNWEWGIQSFDMQIQHQAAALYKPLTNPLVEKYSIELRKKYGMEMVSIFETRAYFEKKKEKPVVYIMAADQRESNVEKAAWINFLGQDTACLLGPEKYAKYNNLPIVFFDVQRTKRGYYTLEIKKLCDTPLDTAPGEITTIYMKMLEDIIRVKPENWLWSHKRWRDKKPSSNN